MPSEPAHALTPSPDDRAARLAAFVAAAGLDPAAVETLPADASFRRYHRVSGIPSRIVMDAPPPREDVRPWLGLALHLRGLGLSAPAVLAEDAAEGFLLIEDLGDDTFTRLLARGEAERQLYALATEALAALHALPPARAIPPGLRLYSDDLLLAEAFLLTDWFLPAITGRPTAEGDRAAFETAVRAALPAARAVPETLVLRDFHVDNLMRLPGRAGIAACGLLDFQDAVVGPLTYDLVSLFEDARRDVDPGMTRDLVGWYLDRFPALARDGFAASWAVLAATRHAKVIGIFTRLSRRDGKHRYLAHIPRVWRLLERAVAHPALSDLRAWLDRAVPPDLRRAPEVP